MFLPPEKHEVGVASHDMKFIPSFMKMPSMVSKVIRETHLALMR
jgi:hypothetical protein